MKLRYIGVFLLFFVVSHAGKVTWDTDGKPIISMGGETVKGCNQGGFEVIIQESNVSKKSCD